MKSCAERVTNQLITNTFTTVKSLQPLTTEFSTTIVGLLGYLTETSCDGIMIGRQQLLLQYKEGLIEVTVICVFCGKVQPPFEVTQKGWERYSSGAMTIYEALPSLHEEERELLISAVCSKCWDELPHEQ